MATPTFSKKSELKSIINGLANVKMRDNHSVFIDKLKSLDFLFGQSNIYQTFEQLKPSKNDEIGKTLLNQITHYQETLEIPSNWPAILGPNLKAIYTCLNDP
jgi:hypothetical protein